MTDLDYAPFHGDGRIKTGEPLRLCNTRPISVTNAQARRAVAAFIESGHSTHSGMGGMLWVIVQWCQYQGVPYELTAWPSEGYYIKRLGPT